MGVGGSTTKSSSNDTSQVSRTPHQNGVVSGLIAAFFLSGFSALIYQVIWQRMLGFFSGSDVRSVTIVTGAFLGGLGVGSLLGGSIADRLSGRQSVRVFALCNVGIAIFAIISRFFFYELLFKQLNSLSEDPTILLLIAFISLLVPTVLMGLSLPLLSRAVVRNVDTAPSLISQLYGLNTLGAAAGIMVGGWMMLGSIGFDRSLYVGGAISLLVALLAWRVSSHLALADSPVRAPIPKQQAQSNILGHVWMWALLMFISGFIAVSLEIIWFRFLSITTRNDTYTFSLMLVIYLIGLGTGTVIGRAVLPRIQYPRRVFYLVQMFIALYSATSMWIVASLGRQVDYVGIVSGTYGDFSSGLLLLVVPSAIILIPSILMGIYFPIVQLAVQTDVSTVGRRVSLIQTLNVLGNAAGSIVTGLILLNTLQTPGAIRLLAGLALVFMLALLAESFSALRLQERIAAVGISAMLLIVIFSFPRTSLLWSMVYGAEVPDGYFVNEDATGVTVVTPTGRFFSNGTSQSSLPYDPIHLVLGALPAIVHPDPETAFVIGIASGGTPYGMGINPDIERITAIEINSSQAQVLESYRRRVGYAPLDRLVDDTRYEIIIGDGRRALQISGQRFDIIEADALLPTTSHSGLLYSQEFFQEVCIHLTEGGIMTQWIPTQRTENTFVSVFPYVIEIGRTILLGSNQPIAYDSDRVLDAFSTPEAQTYIRAAEVDPDDVLALLEWLHQSIIYWSPDAPRTNSDINTDLHPQDEYYRNSFGLNLFPLGISAVSNRPTCSPIE